MLSMVVTWWIGSGGALLGFEAHSLINPRFDSDGPFPSYLLSSTAPGGRGRGGERRASFLGCARFDRDDSLPRMRTLWGLWAVACACACGGGTKTTVIPALTAVDAGRPHFVYAPVEGSACGDHAVARAIEDLFRVSGGVHGFVAAVLEQEKGGDRCVWITARPMTYGCEPNPPRKIDEGKPMHVVPGPMSCAPVVDPCAADCQRFADLLGLGATATTAARERCVTRCRAADGAFMDCARAAATAEAAQACDPS
jgi:hypothetical protein